MVAIVTGNGLGLVTGSLGVLGASGQVGTALFGRGNEGVYVNAATGNLVLRRQDELLIGRGPDTSILRSYNSQGTLNDDNGDNWRLGFSRRITSLTGTVNTANSTITRVDEDGAESVYTYNGSVYVSKEGGGAFDTLSYNAATQEWNWTDGDSRITEAYDSHTATGRLKGLFDADNHWISLTYNTNGRVESLYRATGENIYIDYDNTPGRTNNILRIRTVGINGEQVRTSYLYDSVNRLVQVKTDLTPHISTDNPVDTTPNDLTDNAVAGLVYTTTYTYTDATSRRIASVTQADGSRLEFTYVQVPAGNYRIHQVRDVRSPADIRVTEFAYNTTTRKTTIRDPLNLVTELTYYANGQLQEVKAPPVGGVSQTVSFVYDADGNLQRHTDARGKATEYTYANGNRVLERDSMGNTVTRTYSANNKLLTETRYVDQAATGLPSVPLTTRYAYDTKGHMRYSISAEGRVTEYVHGVDYYAPDLIAQIQYTGSTYNLSGLSAIQTPTEAQLDSWRNGIDRRVAHRTDYSYDLRGQLAVRKTYSQLLSNGQGDATTTQTTRYVYGQSGELLQVIDPRGSATTTIADDFMTGYAYDGLGRQISARDGAGVLTLTTYDDANRRTIVRLDNGQTAITTYDAAGWPVTVSHANGQDTLGTSTYSYDKLNRLRMTTDPTGVKRFHLYDEAGRLVGEIDGTGALIEHRYNANNQLVWSIAYANRVAASVLTTAAANPADFTLALARSGGFTVDAANDRRSYNIYNAAGQLAKTVDGMGAIVEYSYDGAGRQTQVRRYATVLTPAQLTTLSTAAGTRELLPTDVAPTASATTDRIERFFYDSDGRLRGKLDAEGYLQEYRYDAAGRLVQTIAYAGATLAAQRAAGALASLIPAANAADQNSYTLYDLRGRVEGLIDAGGYLTEYRYDAAGNKSEVLRYSNAVAYTTGVRVATLRTAAGTAQSQRYEYDALNQVVREEEPDATVTIHTYDRLGRRTASARAVDSTETRTARVLYDGFGRIWKELGGVGSAALAALPSTATPAQTDAIWAKYGSTHTYDAAGRRTSTTHAFDPVTGVGSKTVFYYNEEGQVALSVIVAGVNPGEVRTVVYNRFGEVEGLRSYTRRITSPASLATLNGGLYTDPALATVLAGLQTSTDDSMQVNLYTRRGELARRTDGLGFDSTFTYTAFGELFNSNSRVDIANNRRVDAYTYDRRGLLVTLFEDQRAGSPDKRYEYDAFGRRIEYFDANDQRWSTRYDRLGRTVETLDPHGANRVTSYDAFSRVLTQRDATGNITNFAYNTQTRTVTVTTAENISIITVKNRHGETQSVKDGLGNTTTYSYNADGRLERTTAPAALASAPGRVSTTSYNAAGQMIETVDAVGNKVIYTYDAAGRVLTRTIDPSVFDPVTEELIGLNLKTTYRYDGQGRNVWVQDANLVWTLTSFDATGRKTEVIVDPKRGPDWTSGPDDNPEGLNLRTTYVYDGGAKLTVTQGVVGGANLKTTEYHYDALGRLTKEVIDPGTGKLNITCLYAYDANGNMVVKTAASGTPAQSVTRYVYDKAGRLQYEVDAVGAVRLNKYDAEGRLVAKTAYANKISFTVPSVVVGAMSEPDILARLTVNGPADITSRTAYDKDGRAVFMIDGTGAVTELVYNKNGNVVKTIAYATPLGTLTSYDLASVRLAANALPATGNRITRNVFDNAGRPAISVDEMGYVTRREFDANGQETRRIRFADPYTAADTDTVATWATRIPTTPATAVVEETAYDAAGRASQTIDGEGFITEYMYDGVGRLELKIRYDADGTGVTEYGYDPAGRLVRETAGAYGPDSATTVYELDALGNRIKVIDPRGVELATADSPWALGQRGALGLINSEGNALLSAELSPEQFDQLLARYTTRNRFDAAGRLVETEDALGGITKTVRDAAGNAVKVIDPRGVELATRDTSWALAERKRLGYVTAGEGKLAAALTVAERDALESRYAGYFYYDAMGRAELHIDPERYVLQTQYNTFGNVVQIKRFAKALLPTVTYNATTRPAAILTDAKDAVTQITVDKAGRQTRIVDAELNFEEITYDALGNKTFYRNKLGGIYEYKYDKRGKVETEKLPITSQDTRNLNQPIINRFTYDSRGNLKQKVEAFGLAEARTTNFVYDRLDRQIEMTQPAVTTFNPANPTQSTGLSGQPKELRSYDARGNVTRVEVLLDLNPPRSAITYFYYDQLNRKIASVSPEGALVSFIYDAANNCISELRYAALLDVGTIDRSSSIPPEPLSDEVRQVVNEYDANNRVIRTLHNQNLIGEAPNNDGNLLVGLVEGVATQNRYDAAGNIVQEIDGRGSSIYRYYDALGRQTAQVDQENYLTIWEYGAGDKATRETKFANELSLVASSATSLAELKASAGISLQDRITVTDYDRMGRVLETRVLNVEFAGVNKHLQVKSGDGIASTYPQYYSNQTFNYEIGLTYRGELTLGPGTTGRDIGLGVDTPASPGTAYRRHTVQVVGNTFRVNAYNGTAWVLDPVATAGQAKSNTTYVVEVVLEATGTRMFVYEKGLTRAQGWTHFLASSGWGKVGAYGFSGLNPGLPVVTDAVDNLSLTSGSTVRWQEDFEDGQAPALIFTGNESGALSTGYEDGDTDLRLSTLNGPAVKWPQFRSNQNFAYQNGLTFRGEVTLGDGGANREIGLGFFTPQQVVGPNYRRLTASIVGNTFHVNAYNGTTWFVNAIPGAPAAKANTTYVIEVVLEGAGTRLYIYEKGMPRAQGFYMAGAPWTGVVGAFGFSSIGPGKQVAHDTVDNLSISRAGVVNWQENFENPQASALIYSANEEGALGRIAVSASDSARTTYAYDGLGAVTRETRYVSALQTEITDRTYDQIGRLKQEQKPQFTDFEGALVRPTTDYTYDGLNNLLSEIARGKNNAAETDDRITRYTYAAGRLTTRVEADGATTRYAYDLAGNITRQQIDRVNADGALSSNILFFKYDREGREILRATTTSNSAAALETKEVRYNAFGEIINKRTNGGGAGSQWHETIAYDNMGRVVKTNAGDGVYRFYIYDANGNATGQIMSAGADFSSLSFEDVMSLEDGQKHITVTRFDKRNQVIGIYQPELTLTPEGASIHQFITQPGSGTYGQGSIRFAKPPINQVSDTAGAAHISGFNAAVANVHMDISVTYTWSNAHSPDSWYVWPGRRGPHNGHQHFTNPRHVTVGMWLPDTSAWGTGNIEIHVKLDPVTLTLNYPGKGTKLWQFKGLNGAIGTVKATGGAVDIGFKEPLAIDPVPISWDRKGVISRAALTNTVRSYTYTIIKRTEQGGSFVLGTFSGTTRLDPSKQVATSHHTMDTYYYQTFVSPRQNGSFTKQVLFKSQPDGASRLMLLTRPQGSNGGWKITDVGQMKTSSGGNVAGYFAFDWSSTTTWPRGGYEYQYFTYNSSGNVINSQGGVMTLSDTVQPTMIHSPRNFGGLGKAFMGTDGRLHLIEQGTSATTGTIYYGRKGSALTEFKPLLSGAMGKGSFIFNPAAYGLSGEYDYAIETRDASGNVVRRALGSFTTLNAQSVSALKPVPTLEFANQPINATKVKLTYNKVGSPPNAPVDLEEVNGVYTFDIFHLLRQTVNETTYQFSYQAVTSGNQIVNEGSGTFTLPSQNIEARADFPVPNIVRFKVTRPEATSFDLYYRNAGSIGGYTKKTLSRDPIGDFVWDASPIIGAGQAVAGYFTVDTSVPANTWASWRSNTIAPYQSAARFVGELTLGPGTNGRAVGLGIANSNPNAGAYRRHIAYVLNDTLYANVNVGAGAVNRQISPAGAMKANTTYVVEVVLEGTGTRLYVYEKGKTRAQGWTNFETATGWGDFAAFGMTGVLPNEGSIRDRFDNLELVSAGGATLWQENFNDGAPPLLTYTASQFRQVNEGPGPGSLSLDYYYELKDIGGNRLLALNGDPIQIKGKIEIGNFASSTQVQWVIEFGPESQFTIARQQTYNAFGEVVQEVDGRGNRTDFSYNNLGHLAQKLSPETDETLKNGWTRRIRPVTEYSYDLAGRVVGVRDPNKNLSTQTWLAGSESGDNGKVEMQFRADGSVFATGYDIFGDARLLNNAGALTVQEFDKRGRVTRVTRPGRGASTPGNSTGASLSAVETFGYDTVGNRIWHVNALGHTAKTYYDALGRVTKATGFDDPTIAGAATATQYTYTYANTIKGAGGVQVGGYERRTITALQGTSTGFVAGGTSIDRIDVFGRLSWRQDYGNRVYTYSYNGAGWLTEQRATGGINQYAEQYLTYGYYANGFQRLLRDHSMGTETIYEYDEEGNRTREIYKKSLGGLGSGQWEIYQNAFVSYDSLNRITRIDDARAEIRYQYDAASNRRRVESYYHDGLDNEDGYQDFWYNYDSMNRVTTTMGKLSSETPATSATDNRVYIDKGEDGVDLEYDMRGQRVKAIYGEDDHAEIYTYTADGYLEKTSIDTVVGDATAPYTAAIRYTDLAGRVLKYETFDAGSTTQKFTRTSKYDADSKLLEQKEWDGALSGTPIRTTTYDYIDTAGTTNNTGPLLKSTFVEDLPDEGAEPTTIVSTYAYQWWDEAKEKRVDSQATNVNAEGWEPGRTDHYYDVNGHLVRVDDFAAGQADTGRTIDYITNAQGLILQRNQIGGGTQTPGGINGGNAGTYRRFYYIDGHRVGDVGNDAQTDGALRVSYAEALAAAERDPVKQRDKYVNWTPVASADFDQNYEPINEGYPASAPSSYTVRMGDTLRSIAGAIWGDSSLWHLIADANGLSGTEELQLGRKLIIPNKVANFHNNSNTYKVYNAGEAIGDTTPTLPDAPPPPVMDKDGGCGGIAIIIVMIVAVVVSAGALGFLSGLAPGLSGISGAISTGFSIMGGGAFVGTGIGASLGAIGSFAVAGAVGSIAGQVVGMALGVQEKFSWSSVATAAIGSAVSGALAQPGSPLAGKAFEAVVGRAVVGNAISQGIGVATGLQKKFSWTGVAAAGMTAAVGFGVGKALEGVKLGSDFANNVFSGTVKGIATGATKALISGQKPNWRSLALENFGQELGSALVGELVAASAQTASTPSEFDGMYIDDPIPDGVYAVPPGSSSVPLGRQLDVRKKDGPAVIERIINDLELNPVNVQPSASDLTQSFAGLKAAQPVWEFVHTDPQSGLTTSYPLLTPSGRYEDSGVYWDPPAAQSDPVTDLMPSHGPDDLLAQVVVEEQGIFDRAMRVIRGGMRHDQPTVEFIDELDSRRKNFNKFKYNLVIEIDEKRTPQENFGLNVILIASNTTKNLPFYAHIDENAVKLGQVASDLSVNGQIREVLKDPYMAATMRKEFPGMFADLPGTDPWKFMNAVFAIKDNKASVADETKKVALYLDKPGGEGEIKFGDYKIKLGTSTKETMFKVSMPDRNIGLTVIRERDGKWKFYTD
jgi:YD repeat-containing protein